MVRKRQALNPYLPPDVYIPDGEPHVFGDRVYVFGSHDAENGTEFCMLDYEAYSAPVNDLTNWRSEGIIYRADQDPGRDRKNKYMYAPDVVQGNDGRFYLYYAMAGGHFTGPIHVAVCDSPAGQYVYYGEVRNPDGTTFDRCITFDPGLLNDNGRIYLYYGWAIGTGNEKPLRLPKKLTKLIFTRLVEPRLFEKTAEQIRREPYGIEGCNVVELADDMLTVRGEPRRLIPGQFDAEGTEFEGHAFFEASSMRKIGDTYYLIYSSQLNHELCYATSLHPDRDFRFGGVLVSNGDIGYQGRADRQRVAMTGNNHGSIERIHGQWYVFYHRHTNKTCYSRQGCAERIEILPDGHIPQVEMTSCGLNGGPLAAEGEYPALICCNLYNSRICRYGHNAFRKMGKRMPYICCKNKERYIEDICEDTVIGYKYFHFTGKETLSVCYRGYGSFTVKVGQQVLGRLDLPAADSWHTASLPLSIQGVHALWLAYNGEGVCALKSLRFEIVNEEPCERRQNLS